MKRKPPPKRRNPAAKALAAPQNRQRVVPGKKRDVLLDWLKKEGATERQTYDEETGRPMRTFTIKL